MEKLPKVEFEGPLGYFWSLKEVPIEAIAKAIRELFAEAERRGYKEPLVLELVKGEIWKKLEDE